MGNHNFVEHVEENISSLERLLGAENVEDVKKRISDLIVKRVADDIDRYEYYLFYPGDYEASIEEAFEKVKKKITKMYADATLESAQEAVKRFKDISMSALNDTPGLKLRCCHECKYLDGNRCRFYEDKKYYWIAHDGICAEEGFVNYKEKE